MANSPAAEDVDMPHFFEDDQRRSRRTGEATQTAMTMLKARTEELQNERDENKKLRRHIAKLQRQVTGIKQERDGIHKERKWFSDRYEYLLEKVLRPYAQSKGMHFRDANGEQLDSTTGPLFHDAIDAKLLREQVSSLQAKVSKLDVARGQLQHSKQDAFELRSLRQQVQILEKNTREMKSLRAQTWRVQEEVREMGNLRQQLQKLQKSALAKVEKVQAIPDNQFAQDFSVIAAMIRTLSRSVCVSNNPDILNTLEAGILFHNISSDRWSTRALKKCFVEAWIWSGLIEMVFFSPFAIFFDDGDSISRVWSKLFDMENEDRWPTPSPQCEAWRCSTMEYMVDVASRTAITHGVEEASGQSLEEHAVHGFKKCVIQSRARMLDILRLPLSQLAPAADLSSVQGIVDKAFTLALDMSLQRSRLRVTWPMIGATFDKERMSLLPNSSGEDVEDGTVAFIVNPGLAKWGNAEGRNMDCRYDIVPCLVQIETSVQTEAVVNQPEPVAKIDRPAHIDPVPIHVPSEFVPPKALYIKQEPED
jgi:hypothetical protein